ncbi:hypothetical protein WM23_00015 [Burkholderia ubonensis]|nr:hypothetical protein WM23_00015 [Burkholderia ubonensis]
MLRVLRNMGWGVMMRVIDQVLLQVLPQFKLPSANELYAEIRAIYSGHGTKPEKLRQLAASVKDHGHRFLEYQPYIRAAAEWLDLIAEQWTRYQDAQELQDDAAEETVLGTVVKIMEYTEQLLTHPAVRQTLALTEVKAVVPQQKLTEIGNVLNAVKDVLTQVHQLRSLPAGAGLSAYLEIFANNQMLPDPVVQVLELGKRLADVVKAKEPYPADGSVSDQLEWIAEVVTDDRALTHAADLLGLETVMQIQETFGLAHSIARFPANSALSEQALWLHDTLQTVPGLREHSALLFVESLRHTLGDDEVSKALLDSLMKLADPNATWRDVAPKIDKQTAWQIAGRVTKTAGGWALTYALPTSLRKLETDARAFYDQSSMDEKVSDFLWRLLSAVGKTASDLILAQMQDDPIRAATSGALGELEQVSGEIDFGKTMRGLVGLAQTGTPEMRYVYNLYLSIGLSWRIYQAIKANEAGKLEPELRQVARELKRFSAAYDVAYLDRFIDLIPLLPAVHHVVRKMRTRGQSMQTDSWLNWSSQLVEVLWEIDRKESPMLVALRENLCAQVEQYVADALTLGFDKLTNVARVSTSASTASTALMTLPAFEGKEDTLSPAAGSWRGRKLLAVDEDDHGNATPASTQPTGWGAYLSSWWSSRSSSTGASWLPGAMADDRLQQSDPARSHMTPQAGQARLDVPDTDEIVSTDATQALAIQDSTRLPAESDILGPGDWAYDDLIVAVLPVANEDTQASIWKGVGGAAVGLWWLGTLYAGWRAYQAGKTPAPGVQAIEMQRLRPDIERGADEASDTALLPAGQASGTRDKGWPAQYRIPLSMATLGIVVPAAVTFYEYFAARTPTAADPTLPMLGAGTPEMSHEAAFAPDVEEFLLTFANVVREDLGDPEDLEDVTEEQIWQAVVQTDAAVSGETLSGERSSRSRRSLMPIQEKTRHRKPTAKPTLESPEQAIARAVNHVLGHHRTRNNSSPAYAEALFLRLFLYVLNVQAPPGTTLTAKHISDALETTKTYIPVEHEWKLVVDASVVARRVLKAHEDLVRELKQAAQMLTEKKPGLDFLNAIEGLAVRALLNEEPFKSRYLDIRQDSSDEKRRLFARCLSDTQSDAYNRAALERFEHWCALLYYVEEKTGASSGNLKADAVVDKLFAGEGHAVLKIRTVMRQWDKRPEEVLPGLRNADQAGVLKPFLTMEAQSFMKRLLEHYSLRPNESIHVTQGRGGSREKISLYTLLSPKYSDRKYRAEYPDDYPDSLVKTLETYRLRTAAQRQFESDLLGGKPVLPLPVHLSVAHDFNRIAKEFVFNKIQDYKRRHPLERVDLSTESEVEVTAYEHTLGKFAFKKINMPLRLWDKLFFGKTRTKYKVYEIVANKHFVDMDDSHFEIESTFPSGTPQDLIDELQSDQTSEELKDAFNQRMAAFDRDTQARQKQLNALQQLYMYRLQEAHALFTGAAEVDEINKRMMDKTFVGASKLGKDSPRVYALEQAMIGKREPQMVWLNMDGVVFDDEFLLAGLLAIPYYKSNNEVLPNSNEKPTGHILIDMDGRGVYDLPWVTASENWLPGAKDRERSELPESAGFKEMIKSRLSGVGRKGFEPSRLENFPTGESAANPFGETVEKIKNRNMGAPFSFKPIPLIDQREASPSNVSRRTALTLRKMYRERMTSNIRSQSATASEISQRRWLDIASSALEALAMAASAGVSAVASIPAKVALTAFAALGETSAIALRIVLLRMSRTTQEAQEIMIDTMISSILLPVGVMTDVNEVLKAWVEIAKLKNLTHLKSAALKQLRENKTLLNNAGLSDEAMAGLETNLKQGGEHSRLIEQVDDGTPQLKSDLAPGAKTADSGGASATGTRAELEPSELDLKATVWEERTDHGVLDQFDERKTSFRSNAEFDAGYKDYQNVALPDLDPNLPLPKAVELMRRFNDPYSTLTPKQMGALAAYADEALERDTVKWVLDFTDTARRDWQTAGATRVLPVPQGFLLMLAGDPDGRCLPLARAMAVALDNNRERQFTGRLFEVAAKPNLPESIEFMTGLQSLHQFNRQLTGEMEVPVGELNIARVMKMIDDEYKSVPKVSHGISDVTNGVYLSLSTPNHAMLTGVRLKQGKPSYFFYDPNMGLAEFNRPQDLEGALRTHFLHRKLGQYYSAKQAATDPLFNVRKISAGELAPAPIPGTDMTVLDLAQGPGTRWMKPDLTDVSYRSRPPLAVGVGTKTYQYDDVYWMKDYDTPLASAGEDALSMPKKHVRVMNRLYGLGSAYLILWKGEGAADATRRTVSVKLNPAAGASLERHHYHSGVNLLEEIVSQKDRAIDNLTATLKNKGVNIDRVDFGAKNILYDPKGKKFAISFDDADLDKVKLHTNDAGGAVALGDEMADRIRVTLKKTFETFEQWVATLKQDSASEAVSRLGIPPVRSIREALPPNALKNHYVQEYEDILSELGKLELVPEIDYRVLDRRLDSLATVLDEGMGPYNIQTRAASGNLISQINKKRSAIYPYVNQSEMHVNRISEIVKKVSGYSDYLHNPRLKCADALHAIMADLKKGNFEVEALGIVRTRKADSDNVSNHFAVVVKGRGKQDVVVDLTAGQFTFGSSAMEIIAPYDEWVRKFKNLDLNKNWLIYAQRFENSRDAVGGINNLIQDLPKLATGSDFLRAWEQKFGETFTPISQPDWYRRLRVMNNLAPVAPPRGLDDVAGPVGQPALGAGTDTARAVDRATRGDGGHFAKMSRAERDELVNKGMLQAQEIDRYWSANGAKNQAYSYSEPGKLQKSLIWNGRQYIDLATKRPFAHRAYDYRVDKTWKTGLPNQEYLPIKKLISIGGNLNDEKIDNVRAAFETGVYLPPIEVDLRGGRYYVIGGGHRLNVANSLNFKNVPVKVIRRNPPPVSAVSDVNIGASTSGLTRVSSSARGQTLGHLLDAHRNKSINFALWSDNWDQLLTSRNTGEIIEKIDQHVIATTKEWGMEEGALAARRTAFIDAVGEDPYAMINPACGLSAQNIFKLMTEKDVPINPVHLVRHEGRSFAERVDNLPLGKGHVFLVRDDRLGHVFIIDFPAGFNRQAFIIQTDMGQGPLPALGFSSWMTKRGDTPVDIEDLKVFMSDDFVNLPDGAKRRLMTNLLEADRDPSKVNLNKFNNNLKVTFSEGEYDFEQLRRNIASVSAQSSVPDATEMAGRTKRSEPAPMRWSYGLNKELAVFAAMLKHRAKAGSGGSRT